MSDAADHLAPEIDAVIESDGRATISSDQVARLGLKLTPGSHLRLVPISPAQKLDELFARGDARRKATGIPPMSDEEAADFAERAVKEVRQRIHAEGTDS